MRLTMVRRLIDKMRSQRGQVIVVAVGVMALALGAIMISVDVGWWLRDKRDAQNDADAIALAAAQELPARDLAEARGLDWADFNGIDPSTEMEMLLEDCPDGQVQGKFCFIDQNSDGDADKVRVKVSRASNSFIAEALGVGSPTLNPPAAAATVYVEGACVMPWGMVAENDDPSLYYGLPPYDLYVFQNVGDFVEGSSGNFGAISIYGEGKDTYKDSIKGSCLPANNACTNDPMVFADETLLGCTSEPGGGGAITGNALDLRFVDAPSPGACDAATYDEALSRVEDSICSQRLVPVAVINAFPPQGSSADITIYGIVNFYLAGWSKNKTCFTLADGSERCGFVWGYLITNAPANTAQVVFTTEFIPFAPTGVALVE
jgi:hypothetical protein